MSPPPPSPDCNCAPKTDRSGCPSDRPPRPRSARRLRPAPLQEDQPVDQRVRLADAAEAAEQYDCAVADVSHGVGHGLHDLVDHPTRPQLRSSPRRRRPRIHMPNMISPWILAGAGMSGMKFTP